MLALRYLCYSMIPEPDRRNPLSGTARTDLLCEKADVALRLHDVLSKEIAASGMRGLLEDVELPLVRVLAEME